MTLKDRIRDIILSRLVTEDARTIGMEEECFIYTANGERIPVNPGNEFSATDLLHIMNNTVGDNGNYTLEPGGQLEWSSPPFPDLNQLNASLQSHKKALKKVIDAHDLKIISFGIDPYYSPDDIDLIDQLKYQLMDANMEKNGTMGKWMMRNSTSIQINFDIVNEDDLEEMVFVADCLHPICAYLFANSPKQYGKSVGTKNLRNIVWENTDNHRCRNLIDHGIGTKQPIIDQFIDYVMTVPGIFELDRFGNIVTSNKTMGERLNELETSNQLRKEDIQAALHQIFTNVRLKDLVEVRGADRPPTGHEMAPVAFWTSVLTVKSVRNQILSVVKNWSLEDRHKFNKASMTLDDSQLGPDGKSYREWNQWIGGLALEGLNERGLGEEKYFESFFELVMEKGPFGLQAQNL